MHAHTHTHTHTHARTTVTDTSTIACVCVHMSVACVCASCAYARCIHAHARVQLVSVFVAIESVTDFASIRLAWPGQCLLLLTCTMSRLCQGCPGTARTTEIARKRASSDEGADQPAEEVEAASVGSEAGEISRKHARSDVGSEASSAMGSVANKVRRLATTVPSFPPSRPAAAPQAATAEAAPKAAPNYALNQRIKVAAAEKNLAHWKQVVECERFQLAAFEEGDRHQLVLQAAPWVPKQVQDVQDVYEVGGPGTPILAPDGREIGYYDPDPDIDRLFIKLWLPQANFLMMTGGIPCRYIGVLDAQDRDTIGDLKAKIVAHPDGGTLTADDLHIFFRGTKLAKETTLNALCICDDAIMHACTQVNADAVAVASEQLDSWLPLRYWRSA